jgi:hypothetical protein
VDSEIVVKQRWEREQVVLGLARDSPDEEFAAGGLGALAVPPTVRIVVLPADPGSQCVPGLDPAEVVPQLATLPGGEQLPQLEQVRGTSSGYVRYPYSGDNGRWRSFAAVHWHGGVDFFLGNQGGHEWEVPGGRRQRVVYLLQSIAWAQAAFDLQRRIIEQFPAAGPDPSGRSSGSPIRPERALSTSGVDGPSPGHPLSGISQPPWSGGCCCWRTSQSGPTLRERRTWRFGSALAWTWPSEARAAATLTGPLPDGVVTGLSR